MTRRRSAKRSPSASRIRDSSSSRPTSGEQALERLADFAFDILITDLRLPGIDGRKVLDAAVERYPDIIAIVITGYGTVKDAVDAIKQGAADFITKPFQFDALLHVLSSALEQRRLRVRERIPPIAARSAIPHRRTHRHEPRDAGPLSPPRNRRGDVEHGPDHRRDRHRKGAGRARDSPQQPAAGESLRRDQLQRDPRNAARGGAVRARARRVHRRGRSHGRDASSRRTRARCFSTKSER